MLKKLNVGRAIMAGVAATGAMTLLMYAAPLMGLPSMDIMYALGSLFPWQISPYIPGAILHVGIGSALALLYALIFARPWDVRRYPGSHAWRYALDIDPSRYSGKSQINPSMYCTLSAREGDEYVEKTERRTSHHGRHRRHRGHDAPDVCSSLDGTTLNGHHVRLGKSFSLADSHQKNGYPPGLLGMIKIKVMPCSV